MPTGYTAPVKDGEITDLKDFATECARAMGAFVHLRDSGNEKLTYPPRPSGGGFYQRELAKAIEESKRWNSLTEEGRYAEWSNYYKSQTLELEKSRGRRAVDLARYAAMLAQINAVEVPEELEKFRDFMVEQIRTSIDFDCGNADIADSYFTPSDYVTWCEHKSAQAERNIHHYRKEVENEWEGYYERVKYINLLIETYGIEVIN